MSLSICPFPIQALHESAETLVSSFIVDPEFPFVSAKSALNKHRLRFGHYAALCDDTSVTSHCADLLTLSGRAAEENWLCPFRHGSSTLPWESPYPE